MKLPAFQFTCLNCDGTFIEPEVPEGSYGIFLLRSDSGERRSLDAGVDPVFDEIVPLVRAITGNQSNDRSFAALHHKAFSATCDPDKLQQRFILGAKPTCPKCDSTELSWKPFEDVPPTEVPEVEHQLWSQLSSAQKYGVIKNILTQTGT